MTDASESKVKDDKKVAYYSALINGWMTTRLQRVKSLLGLSSGGIALLLTLYTTVGATTFYTRLSYLIAALGFCTTIFCSLMIFNRNSNLVSNLIKKDAKQKSDIQKEIKGIEKQLSTLDKFNFGGFVLGVLTSMVVAVLTVSQG